MAKSPFEFPGMNIGVGSDKENPERLIEKQKEEIGLACNEISSKINDLDISRAIDNNSGCFSGFLAKTRMYQEITMGFNGGMSDTIKKFLEKGSDFGKNYNGKEYEEYVKLKEDLDFILVKVKAVEFLERKDEGSKIPEEYKEALLISFDARDVEKIVSFKGLRSIADDSMELSFEGKKTQVSISVPGVLTNQPIYVDGTWMLTVKMKKNGQGKWEVDEKKWAEVLDEDERRRALESHKSF